MELEIIGIYKITNKNNNKIYIGQSIHCGKRFDEHSKGEQFIDMIIQLEGIENFTFEILKEVNREELSYWEDYYIIKFDSMFPNGYNKKWNCSKKIRDKIKSSLKNLQKLNITKPIKSEETEQSNKEVFQNTLLERKSYPNQCRVHVRKKDVNKAGEFMTLNIKDYANASIELTPGALKLYVYMAKNKDDYDFYLSPKDFTEMFKVSLPTYHGRQTN